MEAEIKENKNAAATEVRMGRIEKAKMRVLETRPEMDLENAGILTRSFMQTEGEPPVIRKAKAFAEQCRKKTVTIWEDELIVGCSGKKIRGGLLSADVCWSILDNELDTISTRPYDPFQVSEDDRKLFLEVIKPYWRGRSNYEKFLKRTPPETALLKQTGIVYIDRKAVRGPGELTAGYDWILRDGLIGIKKTLQQRRSRLDPTDPDDHAKIQYLEALGIVADGMMDLAARYATEAKRLALAERNPQRKAELNTIAAICERVPVHPARSFHEALQAVYLYHICLIMEQNAASYNPGRMDQYLYSFFRDDIEAGTLTAEQAQELLDCLWVKFSEPCLFQDGKTAEVAAGYNMFQNVCCGGITETGEDAVNELSYMMLQATMDVQLNQPSLSVRYNPGKNPNRFLKKIVECIALGTGFPAFHSDDVGIKMLLNKGATLKEANNWNPCGCVETNLMGKSKEYTAFADVNLAGIVELVLCDGVHRQSGRRVAPSTGAPQAFETFADFKEAIKTQLRFVIGKVVEANHVLDEVSDERPVPAASLTFADCIESGRDFSWGGAKYNSGNGVILDCVADFINSLAAVKYLIYDTRQLTWEDLISALESDFEGAEGVRQRCLAAPKFGNDDPRADDLAAEMLWFAAEEIHRYRSRHGRMNCGMLPVTAHVAMGKTVGALPSGRRAWTTLTDGISPTGGTDIEGPTAVLRSVSRIPHAMYTSGTLLNMKLDPELFSDDRGVRNMMAYLKALCDLGIYHVQFNVQSAETLLAAQENPEAYRHLLVRVAGYTAYFVELGTDVQNEIIGRTVQFRERHT
jgi:formate C-acetyltransferase